jgi:hypothetical protein
MAECLDVHSGFGFCSGPISFSRIRRSLRTRGDFGKGHFGIQSFRGKINLEEPIGYTAQPGLIHPSVRPSVHLYMPAD